MLLHQPCFGQACFDQKRRGELPSNYLGQAWSCRQPRPAGGQPLPPAGLFKRNLCVLWCPTARRSRLVRWMHGIGKQHGFIIAAIIEQIFMVRDKSLLLRGIPRLRECDRTTGGRRFLVRAERATAAAPAERARPLRPWPPPPLSNAAGVEASAEPTRRRAPQRPKPKSTPRRRGSHAAQMPKNSASQNYRSDGDARLRHMNSSPGRVASMASPAIATSMRPNSGTKYEGSAY